MGVEIHREHRFGPTMALVAHFNICLIIFYVYAYSTFVSSLSSASVCPLIQLSIFEKFYDPSSTVMLGRGEFYMGSEPPLAIPGDGETPMRLTKVENPFWIDTTEVTVAKYMQFVKATNYTTTAEHYGNSFAFWMEVDGSLKELRKPGPWWWKTNDGSNWKSFSKSHERHLQRRLLPVNHVSWDDAFAFCNWSGGRLPSEIEWEYACRGGLEKASYPWGNKLKVNGSHMTNIWQGEFPTKNTKKDGFALRAPVASFPCNAYGIYDVSGNVWEWVDGEWASKSSGYFSPDTRIQKGGSHLCHRKHCYRYRCSARTKASRDSTSSNVGFRCAYDVKI